MNHRIVVLVTGVLVKPIVVGLYSTFHYASRNFTKPNCANNAVLTRVLHHVRSLFFLKDNENRPGWLGHGDIDIVFAASREKSIKLR